MKPTLKKAAVIFTAFCCVFCAAVLIPGVIIEPETQGEALSNSSVEKTDVESKDENTSIYGKEILSKSYGITYLKDVATDVMYMHNSYEGGICIMVDPETGGPLTHTRYMELYEKTKNPQQ